ncbi:MAG TPA: methyltransferase domain-containing protein [Terriglobales bacterium]|nr:methyltransferase domain-containing protein [Terriglobales bacterium]
MFEASGICPIYKYALGIDNVDFSSVTSWKRREDSLIREATDLHGIADATYDFVLSAHNLEHVANPVKALIEWKRVLKRSGSLILVLPNFRFTFDHRRIPTPVSHMLEDYKKGTDERDLSHLPEILALHDLSLDKQAGDVETFKARSLRNFENRCLHHHVFDQINSTDLVRAAGFNIQRCETVKPHHIVILANSLSESLSN